MAYQSKVTSPGFTVKAEKGHAPRAVIPETLSKAVLTENLKNGSNETRRNPDPKRLDQLIRVELDRRKKWAMEVLYAGEADLPAKFFLEMARSGFRSESLYAIRNDPNTHLQHFGGDPDYFIRDAEARKMTWSKDMGDTIDRLAGLDKAHDVNFILFLNRGEPKCGQNFISEPPCVYVYGSRSVQQNTSLEMMEIIEDFSTEYLHKIAIPFSESFESRRENDSSLALKHEAATFGEKLARRHPLKENWADTLTICSWPSYMKFLDGCQKGLVPSRAHAEASANMDEEQYCMFSMGKEKEVSDSISYAHTFTEREVDEDECTLSLAGSGNQQAPLRDCNTPTPLLVDGHRLPALPTIGFGWTNRRAVTPGNEPSPLEASIPGDFNPFESQQSSVSGEFGGSDGDVSHGGRREYAFSSESPESSIKSYGRFSVNDPKDCETVSGISSVLDTNSVRSLSSSPDWQLLRQLPTDSGLVMPALVAFGMTSIGPSCTGSRTPPTTESAFNAPPNTPSLSGITKSLARPSTTSSGRFNSCIPLLADPSAIDILKDEIKGPSPLSHALGGIDLSQQFYPAAPDEFIALLKPTMQHWAECAPLTLKGTAFLFLIFEPEVVSFSDEDSRTRAILESFPIKEDLARFLTILIDEEIREVSITNSAYSEVRRSFDFPHTLARFLCERKFTSVFTLGNLQKFFLSGLTPDGSGKEEHLQKMQTKLQISAEFAEFLAYTYSLESTHEVVNRY